MKYIIAFILFYGVTFPQENNLSSPQNAMTGSMALTWIEGVPHYQIALTPELVFGKFGIGLDVNLRFNSKTHKIRKEDFDEANDFLRMVRYARYGHKGDNFYARAGMLDMSKLGHGFVIYRYRNFSDYVNRGTGIEFDMAFENYGFESVYGDVANGGVYGGRAFVKPIKFTSLNDVPILSKMEVGASYSGDFRGYKVLPKDGTDSVKKTISIIGLDLGLPIIQTEILKSTIYFDYAKINNYGDGVAYGVDNRFDISSALNLFVRFERRNSNAKFIANYFDALYEIDREEKIKSLDTISATKGWYGDLHLSILNTLHILGSYSKLDDIEKSGVLHFETQSGDIIPQVKFAAGYDKKGIGSNSEIFELEKNALLHLTVGYKINPYILLNTVFYTRYDNSGNKKEWVEEGVSFIYNF